MKWKVLAVNRMLLVMIKRRANTFFMIVQRKVLKAAERLVTTVRRRKSERRQEVTLLIWQLPWALSFQRKNNIESCRNLEISTRRRRAGWKHLLILENSAAPSLLIAATAMSLCFIT